MKKRIQDVLGPYMGPYGPIWAHMDPWAQAHGPWAQAQGPQHFLRGGGVGWWGGEKIVCPKTSCILIFMEIQRLMTTIFMKIQMLMTTIFMNTQRHLTL